jgi:hypothetical protein
MNLSKGKIRCEDVMHVSLAQDLSKEVHSRCVKIWALIQERILAFSPANFSKLHFILPYFRSLYLHTTSLH